MYLLASKFMSIGFVLVIVAVSVGVFFFIIIIVVAEEKRRDCRWTRSAGSSEDTVIL